MIKLCLILLLFAIGTCIFGSYYSGFSDVLAQPLQQPNKQASLPQKQQQYQLQPAVKITSPTMGQSIPTGQLTISGTSSDTVNADCQVYADLNDQKPFHKAVASGPGGIDDYSKWSFTYNAIKNGTNNLTSKISCTDSSSPTNNLTKWYSVNVTGMKGIIPQVSNLQQVPSITNGTSSVSLSTLGTPEIGQSILQAVPTPVPPLDPVVGNEDDEDSDDEQDSDDENNGDENNGDENNGDDGNDGNDGSRDEEDDDDEDEQRSQNGDGDDCGIGDSGFPFCDDDGQGEDSNEDGDDCGIGDGGFPFCDGRSD
jgi:Bacterial Ig domain